MLREARRNSLSYRPHALVCLRDFVDIFGDGSMFEDVYSLVEPLIQDLGKNNDQMDIDSASGKESSTMM